MEFRVLGPIEVLAAGRPLSVGGPKPRTLLALLLLERGRPVPVARLMDELWPDGPPPTATPALQVHVSGVRRAVGERLQMVGDGYLLRAAPEEVDALRFETAVQEGRVAVARDPARGARELAAALAMWRGSALAGASRTRSIEAAVTRLDELRLVAIESRVQADLLLGRHAVLVPELIGLVAAYPTRERLVGNLMLALHRCRRDADALTAYRKLSEVLDIHLGVDPGDELRALERAIRRGDPSLAAPQVTGVPLSTSPLVGRRRELGEVSERLASARLLTLTGPGGCGKTRLALELARGADDANPDGAYFVDLSTVSPSGSVVRRAAIVLGVRERRHRPLDGEIVARLKHERCLLVFDNCEHLLAGVAALSDTVLQACSGVRILATSTVPLGAAGEIVWTVPGLGVAGPDADPDEAAACDAVQLLLSRASAAGAGFKLDREQAPLAADICRQLGGLPLAIELAAGRMRGLSLAEIAAHLDRSLLLLSSGGTSTEPRHRTMRAAIDWSHQLLEADERAVLRRLSVVVGTADLEAAEQIGADPLGEPPQMPGQVLDVLLRLVERSMVVAERGVFSSTRYRLLEVIREYASEQFAADGEERRARHRHAAFYKALAQGAETWGRAGHGALLARLDTDLNNLRSAIGWFVGEGSDPDSALTTATAIWWYWWSRGLMSEGRAWLARALESGPGTSPGLRIAALRAAASLARNSGEHDEAYRLGEEALLAARSHGDPGILSGVLNNLCITANATGDLKRSVALADESRRLAVESGNLRAAAAAANNGATSMRCLGRFDEADGGFRLALAEFQVVGDKRGEAAAMGNLGILTRLRGDLPASREYCRACLEIYLQLDLEEGMLDAIEAIACLDVLDKRHEIGLRLLRVAARARDRLGSFVFTPDEVASRQSALTAAIAALGPERSAAIDDAFEPGGLAALAARVLAEHT